MAMIVVSTGARPRHWGYYSGMSVFLNPVYFVLRFTCTFMGMVFINFCVSKIDDYCKEG